MTRKQPSSNRIAAGLAVMLIALAGAAQPGQAQTLRDPTRPPVQFLDPADAAEESVAPVSGLQTIKRTGKRRAALLHGEWVKSGDRHGEAVVKRIDDQSVVLEYPDGRQETIKMYPEVDMQSSKALKRTAGK
jgi:hypothetical protein